MNILPDLAFFPLSAWVKRRKIKIFLKNLSKESITKNELEINFDKNIRPFVKQNVNLADLAEVGIDLLVCPFLLKDKKYYRLACLYDASYYFVLTFKLDAGLVGGAVVGFKITGRDLKIIQIQGVGTLNNSTSQNEIKIRSMLKSLKWERLLVAFAENWAKNNGFRRTRIKKARSNEYFVSWHQEETQESGGYYSLRNDRLKMHYDVTARRSGYKSFNKKWWYKSLA